MVCSRRQLRRSPRCWPRSPLVHWSTTEPHRSVGRTYPAARFWRTIEDRGLRIENGESTDSMHFSILHPQSSILHPPSSILGPLSTAVGLPKSNQPPPVIT